MSYLKSQGVVDRRPLAESLREGTEPLRVNADGTCSPLPRGSLRERTFDNVNTDTGDKTPLVESAVIRLASMTSSVQAAIDSLRDRLKPVLRNEVSAQGFAASKPAAEAVPLADDLFDLADRLESTISQLRSMEERLEI